MSDLTPEKLAELRRLVVDSKVASPGPWRRIGVRVDDRDRFEVATLICEQDAALIAAAVNALPALLDAAAERDEIAGRLAQLLCDLTGGRLSWTTYPVPVMVQEIEQYLSECHESDLKDERDDLAATIGRVREWLMSRGVDAGDRDDDWMTGYRTAQRHAVMDAAALLAIIDGAAEGLPITSERAIDGIVSQAHYGRVGA